MSLLQHFLDRPNALLVKLPSDDVLLDIQVTLSQALQDLEVHGYQQSSVMGMKHELHYSNCQSHKSFMGCMHPMLERM